MEMARAALVTMGIFATFGAILQVLRLITGFEVTIAGWEMPVEIALPGLLLDGGLAVWMFVAAKRLRGDTGSEVPRTVS